MDFISKKKKKEKRVWLMIRLWDKNDESNDGIFFGTGVFGKLWKFYTRRIGMIRVEFYDLEIFS